MIEYLKCTANAPPMYPKWVGIGVMQTPWPYTENRVDLSVGYRLARSKTSDA